MDDARSANFNIVYFQVRGAADAIYRSSIEPCAVVLCGRLGGTATWDPLEVAVREAHARGLELHAWLNAFTGVGSGAASTCATLVESASGNPRHILKEHPEWAMVDDAGVSMPCPNNEEYVWLSPGNPGVRTQLARVAADVVRRYGVDGIHLDRIRYPGTRWSYDPASLAEFGKSPGSDPGGWAQFRRDLVGRAVREAFDSVVAVRPATVLSVAAWGIYQDKWGWNSSQGYSQYLQDPRAWAKDGYLDVTVPMTYFAINSASCSFADWICLLEDHLRGVQAATGHDMYIAIAANKGSPESLRQVQAGRAYGVKGFAFYSYSSAAAANLFIALAAGPFSAKASIPRMLWR